MVICFKKILITAPWFTKSCLNELKKNFYVTINNKKTWFAIQELLDIIDQFDAVIAGLDNFTSSVIEKGTKLKIIARRGIGYDKIDLDSCARRGVIVTNTPVPEEHLAVAEFTIGLILDVMRNITFSYNSLHENSWEREAFVGKDLLSSHVGILGLGHIGGETARILSSMGVNVSYCDPYVDDHRYRKVDINTLFEECNVISIHLPKTEETIGLVDSHKISRMKKGSCIVNTSRGEVLNELDVCEFIDNGTLKGVATDVFQIEPPVRNALLSRKEVIATPHIAAFSENSFLKIDSVCVENVYRVLIENAQPRFVIV